MALGIPPIGIEPFEPKVVTLREEPLLTECKVCMRKAKRLKMGAIAMLALSCILTVIDCTVGGVGWILALTIGATVSLIAHIVLWVMGGDAEHDARI